jgi:acyl-CoA thioesterase II
LPADVAHRNHHAGDGHRHAASHAVTTFSALIDHALWFHRPVDLSGWVLSDQISSSGVGGRGLARATMHNRSGQLVCIATQELYFGRAQAG